jgi:hypothetical protein
VGPSSPKGAQLTVRGGGFLLFRVLFLAILLVVYVFVVYMSLRITDVKSINQSIYFPPDQVRVRVYTTKLVLVSTHDRPHTPTNHRVRPRVGSHRHWDNVRGRLQFLYNSQSPQANHGIFIIRVGQVGYSKLTLGHIFYFGILYTLG